MMSKQVVHSSGVPSLSNGPGVLGFRLPWAFAILLLTTAVAYSPVLVFGYSPNGWDSRYHAIIARLFSDQLWSGDLYPRWLMGMNSGLGSPHFFFYQPLGFYIASLFSWIGGPTAVPQLGAAIVLLGFVSGVTCYLWLARMMPSTAAVVGAVFYLSAPVHLFTFLLMGGGYPTFVAMAFTPLCLLGVELFRERKWYGLPIISLGFCAVTLSHIVVGLMFSGIPTVYFLARSGWRRGWLWGAVLVLVACGVGLGGSGFYLVPALAYRPDAIIPVWTLLPENFMFGFPSRPYLLLFYKVVFFCYGGFLIAATAWWRRSEARASVDGNMVITCIFLGLATLSLMTIWTRPLWLMVPVAAAVQFTPRLLAIVDLCLAGLVGSFIASLAAQPRLPRIVFAACLVFVGSALVGAAAAAYSGAFDYNALLWQQRLHYTPDYRLFRPLTVHAALPADNLGLYYGPYSGPVVPLPPHVKIEKGDAQVRVLTWEPRRIILNVQAKSPGELIVGQLYFPGWQAIDALSGNRLPIAPSSGQGLLTIRFPTGNMRLHISLAPRQPEYEGVALSIFSFASLVLLALASRRAMHRVSVPEHT